MTFFKKSVAALIVIATLLSVFLCVPASKVAAAGTSTPFYNWKQYDPQWKDVYIGSNTIGNIGCYATSAAMLIVYSGLKTEADFDPATFVYMMKEKGGFEGNLIYKGKINQAIPGFNYCGEVLLGKTKASKTESISYYLEKGYYIIAGVKNLGHYVAIREVENDVVYMMDPASECNVLFDYYSLSGVTKIFLYTSTGKKVNIGEDVDNNVSGDTSTEPQYKTGIYKTTSALNLREEETTASTALTIIPLGTEITVTSTNGIWGKTSFGGFDGYISLEYASLITEIIYKNPSELSSEDPSSEEPSSEEPSSEEPSSEEPSSEEPSSEEPSSEEPSSEAPSSEEPSSEEPSSQEPSSEEPSLPDNSETPSEYVPGRYLLTGNVNFRKGPGTSYASIGTIPKGTEIEVTEVTGKWAKTTYNGKEGYCGLTYSKLLEEFHPDDTEEPTDITVTTDGEDKLITPPTEEEYKKGYYTILERLNLRETPTTNGAKLAIMSVGTKLQVTEIRNGWGYVVYNQLKGWCSLKYCEYNEAYVEKTEFSADGITGIINEEADLSRVNVITYYSDGSVYAVSSGIEVSYAIPKAPSIVTATAKYNGKEYSFKIAYVDNAKVEVKENATYVIVSPEETAEKVFGDNTIQITTGLVQEISGVTFTVILSGDVDGTGDISSTDYLRIKSAFTGTVELNTFETLAADFNSDGYVNSTDYLLIKTFFLK